MPFRCTLICVNADLFLVSALALVFYDTALECKQRIVSAAAYVVAGMDLRTPLANQNVPREYVLSVRSLMPRRLDSESRPFLELPTPFLCAIGITPRFYVNSGIILPSFRQSLLLLSLQRVSFPQQAFQLFSLQRASFFRSRLFSRFLCNGLLFRSSRLFTAGFFSSAAFGAAFAAAVFSRQLPPSRPLSFSQRASPLPLRNRPA